MYPAQVGGKLALAGAVRSTAMIAATAASVAMLATAAVRAVRVIGSSFGWWASLRKLEARCD